MTRPALGDRLISRLYDEPRGADPLLWIEKKLGVELWSKEREIVESVCDNRLTAVPSGNGCGKSFTAAAIASWWVAADPGADRFVLMSAPSASLIGAVLWAELREHHRRGGLPGELLGSEWRIRGRQVGLAKKTSDFLDEGRAESGFAGLHRRGGVLVVLDESSGIEPWLWTAVRGLTTSPSSRILCLGNPLRADGEFARVCAPGSGWNVIRVNVLESPNFTNEAVSPALAESLPTQVWVDELEATYGRGSAAWLARVEGRFPSSSEDGLIQANWIEAAHQRESICWGPPILFSADIARAGSDETCVYRREGEQVRLVHSARGADLMATTGRLARLLADEPGSRAVVDEAGLGAGVVDRLREEGHEVRGFNGAARPRDPGRFANARAESFWRLREALQEGELDLDPGDEALSRQLLAIRWALDSRGRTVIESKDSMRRRGVSSPDRADALSMALAADLQPPMPVVLGASQSLTSDLLSRPRDHW